MPELIGWGSALILLPAFGLQTYRQWKNRHEPVNPSALWFFVLVLIGTGGQVVYSWMVRNWVYLALNSALVINNVIGLGIAIRRWKGDGPVGTSHLFSDTRCNQRAPTPNPGMYSAPLPFGPWGRAVMRPDDRDEEEHPGSLSDNHNHNHEDIPNRQ